MYWNGGTQKEMGLYSFMISDENLKLSLDIYLLSQFFLRNRWIFYLKKYQDPKILILAYLSYILARCLLFKSSSLVLIFLFFFYLLILFIFYILFFRRSSSGKWNSLVSSSKHTPPFVFWIFFTSFTYFFFKEDFSWNCGLNVWN